MSGNVRSPNPSTDFKHTASYIEDTLGEVEQIQTGVFGDPDYPSQRRKGEEAFPVIAKGASQLLCIAKGEQPRLGSDVLRGAGINFADRIFGEDTVDDLSDDLSESVGETLEHVIYLGVTFHLLFSTHDGRAEVPHLDDKKIIRATYEWLPRASIAKEQMSEYNEDFVGIPEALFDRYFSDVLEERLKEEWGLWFWKRGKAEAQLKNLFFAGTYLAMCMDLIADDPATEVSLG